MSRKNSKENISIIAIHHSTDEILNKFIENISFANDIIILDLTKEAFATFEENVILKKVDANQLEHSYKETFNVLKNEWFLYLYTTYLIPPNLKSEIFNSIRNSKNDGYRIKKEFIFLNKKLKFGTIEREATPCLLKKNNKSSNLQNKFYNSYPSLENKIINNSYYSFDTYNSSLTLLNTIEVEQLFLKKIKPSYYDFLFKPFSHFIKNYFFKGEILNGKEGYILTYIHSFAILKKQLQLWLKYKNLN